MSAAAFFAQANALMGQRRFAEAEPLYRLALQQQPGFADAWLNLGVAQKAQGRLGDAEASYRQALAARPDFVEALNNLANVLGALGRVAEAEERYRQALFLRPGHLEALLNLARIQLADGRVADAEACSRRAVELRPDLPEAHNSLGVALKALARSDEAAACYRRALQLRPDHAEALNNLGNLLQQQGQFAAAEPLYRHALVVRPDYAEALNNLGNSLHEQGRYAEAETSYRQALALHPAYVEAQGHLGAALKAQGRLPEAEAAYQRALELRPDDVVALNNLAQLQITQGHAGRALGLIMAALALDDRPESRLLFMDCITRLTLTQADNKLRAMMIRALGAPWGQAGSLARVGVDLVKLGLGEAGVRGFSGGDSDFDFGPRELAATAADPLLAALLCAAQLRDPDLECFLVHARQFLLDAACIGRGESGGAPDDESALVGLDFFSALAQQCFINEYVFLVSAREAQRAAELSAAVAADLAADRPVSALELCALASYFPLHALAGAVRLLDRAWPDAICSVLRQQLREPWRESELATSIPLLTPIDDVVSVRVQQQYSENPYPRWMSADIALAPKGINEYLRACFPGSPFRPLEADGPLQLLVAGCGTGLQPIGAARRFRDVKVLAVDLSLPSLGYARRKAEEMGLANVEFAQADILKLGVIGRSFDVIESAGVLHHLASIDQGLNVLVSLLRPGGFLQLGLYSRIARRDITRARACIAERGGATNPDEIRRWRQELVASEDCRDLRAVTRLSDFFGTSTCRDLLFHVQETCIDLLELKALLARHRLAFLGFDIDAWVKHDYRLGHPGDPAATDLDGWHEYETAHPDTFIGMYQFWVQKAP